MTTAHAEPPAQARGRISHVTSAGLAVIVLQLALRAWSLYPSWFYTDDYRLLFDARGASLGWSYLSAPFDSQFMPLGRLVVWIVAQSGQVNWVLAASLTLLAQALASVACLWMLVTLFGRRWTVVALLSLYLFSAVTVPAMMWWAASLNQLPLQAVLFASVAGWTHYLRTRNVRWLALTAVVLAIGLLSYVKTVLVVLVLAYLLLAYFVDGGALGRLGQALRRYWAAATGIGAISVAFIGYYSSQVPSIFATPSWALAGDLARSMIGTALTTGLVGGPWRWTSDNPPVARADPPAWAVVVAAVLLVAFVAATMVRRRRAGRAFALLALYVLATFVLLLTSRAPVIGASIGLELRYLTDVVPVAVLCLGLATLPLLDARESSEARGAVRRSRTPSPRLRAVVVGLVCLSGIGSTLLYASIWHDDNPGDRWAHRVMSGLADQGAVDVADAVVRPAVVPGFSYPNNTLARLLPLLASDVDFPSASADLLVLDDSGEPRRAVVDPVSVSGAGPEPDCGFRVSGSSGPTRIALEATTLDFRWWIRIGYLGSADDEVTITAAERTVETPVLRGLHNLFVEVTGRVSSVTLDGLSPGSTMCVDVVEVGTLVPGGPL